MVASIAYPSGWASRDGGSRIGTRGDRYLMANRPPEGQPGHRFGITPILSAASGGKGDDIASQ